MLTNYLWGNWEAEKRAEQSLAASRGLRGTVGTGVSIRDEEEKVLEETIQDLDELADRLLTQFPAYGSNNASSNSQGPDWLVSDEEHSNDMTSQSHYHHSLSLENTAADQQERLTMSMQPPKSSSALVSILAESVSTRDWDRNEKFLWKVESGIIEKKPVSGSVSEKHHPSSETHPGEKRVNQESSQQVSSISGLSNRDFYNDRQHWMPDQLCKHCYACDAPFTVFRRRHHCRLCGQVFCSSCSAYFVPSQKRGNSTLRTCQMCYDQVDQNGGLVVMDANFGKTVKSLESDGSIDHPEDERHVHPSREERKHLKGKGLIAAVDEPKSIIREETAAIFKSVSQRIAVSDIPNYSQQRKAPMRKEADKKLSNVMVGYEREHNLNQWLQHQERLADSEKTKEQEIASGKEYAKTNTLSAAKEKIVEANHHLGLTAASHLAKMCEELLKKDAPLLLREIATQTSKKSNRSKHKWIHNLMTLATRCCATVEPNVKKGDLLDIRPYVKTKVIPGGTYRDCAYVSGIIFRKTVSHKKMAKEIIEPKILLLSGGIEFTRTENRIASLHTIFEQEGKYMELLVGRILKLKPDILIVGRSVSRRALELLLKANVVLIQHVKPSLMSRISRQTGATIISTTDHIMNQFGAHVLGSCNRFRLVTFRDNEIWVDKAVESFSGASSVGGQRSIAHLLSRVELSHHERQAALAANMLGEGVLDGAQAVKCGLAKRGVALTYVMLEGCPKHLGCTVVLRGAKRAALKQVKRVFRFLVNVAYNLKLETSYLKERCVRIDPGFELKSEHIFSSSLCVDYGAPPNGRKVRPWNGGKNESSQRSISGEITAFDHQSILITSVWMTEKTQCCPAEVKGICYYSLQDVSLGQFLRDSCFNLSLKCQNPACKKSVLDHSLSFVHKDGLIKITVEHLEDPLPPAPVEGSRKAEDGSSEDDVDYDGAVNSIATWTYCNHCAKVVTPLVYISENTWKFSFGKFLEVFFYNRDAIMNTGPQECSCPTQTATILYFGCGKLAARFAYEKIRPFGVFVRRTLPIDVSFHRDDAISQLERISMASSRLFVKFDKHIDRVAREARSLFGSAANRPEHLQTVLSELNRIGSEVDHAAMTLQEKIASVSDKCRRDREGMVNEALFRFPWFSRRYLFMLTSAWNERLSAAGQAIVAMKKLASSAIQRGDSVMGPNGPSPGTEELMEGMRRLRQLNDVYSSYNVTDITTVLPTIPGSDTPQHDIEGDDDFEDADVSIDFTDGVDADVLASRRRFNNTKLPGFDRNQSRRPQLQKTLGTQRSFDSSHSQQDGIASSVSSQPRVTPGGAVKSAITRFFNRGGRESDPYLVDLVMFNEGRPRLEPGLNGIVVPVFDEQLSTIIAYSLSSKEYARQFISFVKMEQNSFAGESQSEVNRTVETRVNDNVSGSARSPSPKGTSKGTSTPIAGESISIEQSMLVRNKSHIKHTFRDYDEKGLVTCKFVCTTYWATQFHAVRQVFLTPVNGKKDSSFAHSTEQQHLDVEKSYVQSLSSAFSWAASGGKSGASFARTSDDRFVIKCISRTELQMFLDCAPAYFEYLSKAFFHGLPTVLCKIVGVYQIGYHNRETGKRSMEQVAVMQNIFYKRKISRTFDLKGSLRGRFAAQVLSSSRDENRNETHVTAATEPPAPTTTTTRNRTPKAESESEIMGNNQGKTDHGTTNSVVASDVEDASSGKKYSKRSASGTQLDGDFLEFTLGRPMPLHDRAKSLFHMSIQNDTLFLSIINVLDYSILVGIDEENMELVVGIIDFMRQYDILKQMERVGKSLPMVVGSEAPTIIQPPLYKARFTNAMERYFMTVPCKWTTI